MSLLPFSITTMCLERLRETFGTFDCIHSRRILIVGGFQSSSERLNDVWVYSVVSRQWEEKAPPPLQGPTVFSSRGGHSACYIGSQLWVYGGHGGALYSRKDLEDVCVLDLEMWKWVKVRLLYCTGCDWFHACSHVWLCAA